MLPLPIVSRLAVVLFTGDSTIRFQYHEATHLFAEPLYYIELKQMSRCRASDAWEALRRKHRLGTQSVSLVYTNFAALHTLHLHPSRPWWGTAECKQSVNISAYANWTRKQEGWVADYAGNALLNDVVRRELTTYAQLTKQVVVMMPNFVCDSKYGGDYDLYTHSRYEQGLQMCSKYISEKQRHAGWPHAGKNAYNTCRDGQLSGHGSLVLESRLRAAVLQVANNLSLTVQFVEATRMTKGQCNESLDGRHYSTRIVRRQLAELQSLVANQSVGAVKLLAMDTSPDGRQLTEVPLWGDLKGQPSTYCGAADCTNPFSLANLNRAFQHSSKLAREWSIRSDQTRELSSQLAVCGVKWDELGVTIPAQWNFSSPQMAHVVKPLLNSGTGPSRVASHVVLQQLTQSRPPTESFGGPVVLQRLLNSLDRDGFATFGPELGFQEILRRSRLPGLVEEAFARQLRRPQGAAMIPFVAGIEPLVERVIDTVGQVVLHYIGAEAELDGFAAFRLQPTVNPPHTHDKYNPNPVTSALWHHDRCGRRVKAYIFLQNVTHSTHPTEIVAGSHRRTYFSYGEYHASRFRDSFVASTFNATPMLGNLGDGFIFDTNTIHRGRPGIAMKRDVILFEFNVPREMAAFASVDRRHPRVKTLCTPSAFQPNTSFTLSRIRRQLMHDLQQ